MFLTRIPVSRWADHSEERLNRSAAFFPLVGMIVGAICAGVFLLCSRALSREASILLSMAAGILTTGAFHEDGFADFCDGFGGGWTKEKILEIMKDSRIGAFGAIGLVLILLLKYRLLLDAASARLPLLMISAHAVSRMMPVWIMWALPYVRDASGMAKPIAISKHFPDLAAATLFGFAPLLGFENWHALIPPALAAVPALLLGLYMKKWIGGYTGDCLGAVQQVTEITYYAAALGIWSFL